jgi:nitroimidazol reductase NimA-like FMN-containing flavoprotein (pyridoxamine 5'-phosphate oxidase superfamily)
MAILLEEEAESGFEALDEEECLDLLHHGSVGRVAVSVGAIPTVLPVNYHAFNGDIYFFTAEGTKLAAATRRTVVAFEIDHFDAQNYRGWSVLAVGHTTEVHEPLLRELAVHFPLQPWAPGSRSHLVQIRPTFVSGRRITFGRDGPGTW